MKKYLFIVLLLAGTVTAMCRPTFYLRNKGACMPVVVRGYLASHVLIVFIHGGPGGSGLSKIGTTGFALLEDEYGVVYWDQRGSGRARGGARPDQLNLDQSVDDLATLVTVLRRRYPAAMIFLMGHSWGGCVAAAYLLDQANQSCIAGWIDVAGAHNNPSGDSLSMAFVKDYADACLAKGQQRHRWTAALRWYARNPEFTSAQLRHYVFVRKAHGYVNIEHRGEHYPGYVLGDLFRNPFRYAAGELRFYRTLRREVISDIDLTGLVTAIHIPSLILWGDHDGVIPPEMGLEMYSALGAVSKSLVILRGAAHTSFYETPELFASCVKRFIDAHKSIRNPMV